VHKLTAILAITAATTLAACNKTGEGEYQVKTPDVDVSTDTTTVRTPSVDVGTDTVQMKVPDVDVKTPSQRESAAKTPPPPTE
jgi:hypothetical protein